MTCMFSICAFKFNHGINSFRKSIVCATEIRNYKQMFFLQQVSLLSVHNLFQVRALVGHNPDTEDCSF